MDQFYLHLYRLFEINRTDIQYMYTSTYAVLCINCFPSRFILHEEFYIVTIYNIYTVVVLSLLSCTVTLVVGIIYPLLTIYYIVH
jgi:hypothetical protein